MRSSNFTRAGTLDLTVVAEFAFLGVEIVDITSSGDNVLTMELRDLVHASSTANMLMVLGDAGGTLNADLSGGGFSSSTVLVGVRDYSNGVLTLRVADALTQSGVQL